MFISDIKILDLTIPTKWIYFVFIILAAIALLLFFFNLIFKKSSSKFNVKIAPEEVEKHEVFEKEMNNIENEIDLVLQVQKQERIAKTERRKGS